MLVDSTMCLQYKRGLRERILERVRRYRGAFRAAEVREEETEAQRSALRCRDE